MKTAVWPLINDRQSVASTCSCTDGVLTRTQLQVISSTLFNKAVMPAEPPQASAAVSPLRSIPRNTGNTVLADSEILVFEIVTSSLDMPVTSSLPIPLGK